jgi:hypothetical protein
MGQNPPESITSHVDFDTVDAVPNPQRFVRYLENARGALGFRR